jgi:hypothetical protein
MGLGRKVLIEVGAFGEASIFLHGCEPGVSVLKEQSAQDAHSILRKDRDGRWRFADRIRVMV